MKIPTVHGIWATMFTPPAAVVLAAEIDKTQAYGRTLGLTDEQIKECIDREFKRARTSPDPVRWNKIRRAMIDVASQR